MVLKSIKEPIFVDNNVVHISTSGGVVFFPEHGDCFEELLKNADAAMYKAKETEKGSLYLHLKLTKYLSKVFLNPIRIGH